MTIPDYNSPAALKALLDANGFSMQKKFGQNFLVNAQALTAPVTLSLFGTFMPVGVIATTLVSPLVTVFIYAGIVCIGLSLALPFFAPLAGAVMNAIYGLIKLLVLFFARAPYVHIA